MINIKKSCACEFFYKYGIKKSTFQKTLVNIIKEKISREFLAERIKKRDTNMAFEYSRDERWAATRRKSFNVEKRASLLTQRRSNQLHARATEWQWRRFLSIIKPDTEPSLISAADLINHERPRYICICVCVHWKVTKLSYRLITHVNSRLVHPVACLVSLC